MDPDEFIPTRVSVLERLKDWEDQASWREFFDTYWRLIYGVARKAGLGDAAAQDVVQETLLAVAKKMPGFTYDPAKDSFKGWLMSVTQWKIADQFRKQQPVGTHPLRSPSAAGEDADRTATVERVSEPAGFDLEGIWNAEWQAHLLTTALNRVKRRIQPVLYEMYYLHVVKEKPVREVSRALGVGAVRIYLAKHRVGRLLKKEIQRLEKEML